MCVCCASGGPAWQGTCPAASPGEGKVRDIDRGLGRHQRLRESALFREAFDRASGQAGRYVVFWYRSAPGAARRLGVVASKRTFPRAVDRSRAKRMLREAYRLNRHRVDAGCDVVLVARRRILDARLADIERDLLAVVTKSGLLGKE